ncbi:cysteine hydrolase family protein [Fredinandcohnia humi]
MVNIEQNVPLIIIDVQKAFLDPSWGNRNNLNAEENIKLLLKCWRETNRPVIFIQHISTVNEKSLFYIKNNTSDFMDGINPREDEIVFRKTVNSSFIGTNLEKHLLEIKAPNVVIVGLTTNHCVETTTRMAGNLGFSPILVSDATATFDRKDKYGTLYQAEDIHNMTLVNLHEEFAFIATTEEVLERVK